MNNGIWHDFERWQLLMDRLIEEKCKKLEMDVKSHNKIPSFFKNMLSKFNKQDYASDLEKNKKITVYNYLQTFIFYFNHTCIPIQKAGELLMQTAIKHNIESSNINMLLLSLEAGKKGSYKKRSTQEVIAIKRKKLEGKYKCKKLILLHLTLSNIYLHQVPNISLVCKQLYPHSSRHMYKRMLLLCKEESTRFKLWKLILKEAFINRDYNAFKNKLINKPNTAIDDIIKGDVERSYLKFSNLPQKEYEDMLQNVLQIYSIINPEVQYCQGMNFVVGFLCNIYKNEQTVFNVYTLLMQKCLMDDLYLPDLPLLHQFFFQLEKICSIYLPNLHVHLQSEGVNYSFFSSAWFLTVFTHSLQFEKSEKFPPLLLVVWDLFLLDGWKAIFRTILIILSCFEEQINDEKFEDIMVHMHEKVILFLNEKVISKDKYLLEYKSSPVTSWLLRDFQSEYKKYLHMSNVEILEQIKKLKYV